MALFTFKVQQGTNQPIKGTMDVGSTKRLASSLREQGFRILSLKKASWLYRQYYAFKKFLVSKISISASSRRIFCAEMGTLLKAGLNTNDAILQCISTGFDSKFNIILMEVYQSLQKGESLEEAFSKFPKAFPPVFLNLLRQSKHSGKSEIAFQQYEQLCIYQQKIQHGVVTQIIPQAFLAIAITVFVYFLREATHLDFQVTYGRTMPFWSRMFVEGLPWLLSYKVLFTILGFMAFLGLFNYLVKKTRLVLWLPFFNKSALLKTRINFIKVLSIGIHSNVPTQLCFLAAKESIEHNAFKKWAIEAETALRSGVDFTTTLMKTRLLTPLQKSLVASAGGQSENMGKSFDAILEFLERDIESYNVLVVQVWKLLVMVYMLAIIAVTFLAYLYPLLGWVNG